MDQSYVRHLLPRLARRAGVERRAHAHGLRHAFAVDFVRAGAPLYVVRDVRFAGDFTRSAALEVAARPPVCKADPLLDLT
jgi:integrase-like protein